MAIQTVIMAGGEGVRLRPLTQYCPKPLAPMCGEAVMAYTLKLLRRHGICRAYATLWFRPEDVMREFGAGRHGVELTYSVEDVPLGTAGSVKRAVGRPADTVLVLSGDGLTGCDLTRAIRFHRQRKAQATLVLTQVENPLQYGVVVTDNAGRIQRFIEKPDWSRVIGSRVNTGIYLLEPEALQLIPDGEAYDFGRQLFPRMLEMGLPVYGYQSDEYWCDVGDPAAFLRAQGDLLRGCTGFEPADRGINALPAGYISSDSYVSRQAQIAPDAVIEGSCILPGAVVRTGARIQGSIIGPGAYIGKGAVLKEGSMLGSGARLGDFACCEGGRLFANAAGRPGEVIRAPVMAGREAPQFLDGRAAVTDPQQIARMAGALVQTAKSKCFAVMHTPQSETAAALWLGALHLYGAKRVQTYGCGAEGMLSYAMTQCQLDAGVYVGAQGIKLFSADGRTFSHAQCMHVLTAYDRCETPAAAAHDAIIERKTVRGAYMQWLAHAFSAYSGRKIRLEGEHSLLRTLTAQALEACGHRITQTSTTAVQVRGDNVYLKDENLPGDEDHRWLHCAVAWHCQDKPVYDTKGLVLAAPWILPYDDSAPCREQERSWQDTLARTLMLLQEATDANAAALPALARRSIRIPCAQGDKGRVLEALLSDAAPCLQGGLQMQKAGAHARIQPDPVLPVLRVTACACSAENAQELCDLCHARIREITQKKENTGKQTSGSSA